MVKGQDTTIDDELTLARDAIVTMSNSLGNKYMSSNAIGRSYYAIFHFFKALLVTKGIQVESHDALGSMFSLHFSKHGIMPSAPREIKEAMDARHNADYVGYIYFSVEEAATICLKSVKLIRQAMPLINKSKYVSEDKGARVLIDQINEFLTELEQNCLNSLTEIPVGKPDN